MHAKTDSDSTSLQESSPARSPSRRAGSGHGPVYYVQSPSRDSTSHDGEKTTNSFHSTPAISPMGSPPHSHSNSSLGPHSRESSSTRYSGSGKPKRKARGTRGGGNSNHHNHPFDAIEEENLLAGDEEGERRIPRKCWYFIWFVVAFVTLFTFFSLVLWGASRNQKPIITMKSIKFVEFEVQAGQDKTGVPTGLATLNATVKMKYRNRGTFFGVHVTSTPLDLSFQQQLILATGTMKYFYQRRKSEKQVTVQLKGDSVPLYGGGYSISSDEKGDIELPVALTLNFRVRSRAYVLGRLVKPKFYKAINCSVVMNPKKMNVAMSLKHNCTYT
ncbi:Integrin alpha-L [Bienertia sinuspersici]